MRHLERLEKLERSRPAVTLLVLTILTTTIRSRLRRKLIEDSTQDGT